MPGGIGGNATSGAIWVAYWPRPVRRACAATDGSTESPITQVVSLEGRSATSASQVPNQQSADKWLTIGSGWGWILVGMSGRKP